METKWSYATLALYLIIALVISLLFKRSIIAKKKKSKFPTYIFYYMVIFIILILFSCFRTIDGNNRIGGADAPNYIKMFQEAQMPKFNIWSIITFKADEFIFFSLLYLVKLFTLDYHILFFIIYSIIIFAYIFFVHKEIKDENEWIVLMLLILPFIMSFNIIRNCLATAVSIFALYFLRKNKNIKFIITALCAFFIHYTAIIVILFYLYDKIFFKKVWKNKILYICLIIMLFIASALLRPVFSMILLHTGYFNYAYPEISLLGYIPKLLLLCLVFIVNKELQTELEKENQLIYLSAFSFWNLVLPIFIFMGGADRIRLFFEYSIILLLSKILKIMKVKFKYKEKNISIYIQIIAVILIISWIIFRIYKIGFSYGIMPYATDLI